jgi:alpha-beta hydrolase superfamily lysophospholipase
MSKGKLLYRLFLLGMVLAIVLAAIPIVASDLFREPYSPLWSTVYDVLDLFQIDPYPTGGGAPPRFPYWRNPADDFLYYRDVTLTTADGVNLAASYVPALTDGAPDRHPTVLLCHGLQDHKETMLNLVPWLHRAGYNVMLFDFRGHGASDKRPTTIGRLEALDVEAALDWLEAEGVGESIGGLGMSLGAAALVNAAVEDPRLDALVLDSLFADWGDTDFARDYRLPPEWLVPDVPNPVDIIPRVHVPVFIIHGTADILASVDHARRLYAAANEPKEMWINDSGHAWSAWTYPELYREKVLDFFGRWLRAPLERGTGSDRAQTALPTTPTGGGSP